MEQGPGDDGACGVRMRQLRASAASCARLEAARLRFSPHRPVLHAALTCATFVVWALVGYLLPEDAWDRAADGAWNGYKGKSSYCERIRHSGRVPNATKAGMFMAQPANSLSNYCFVAYGFVLLALFWRDIARRPKATSVENKDAWMLETLRVHPLGEGLEMVETKESSKDGAASEVIDVEEKRPEMGAASVDSAPLVGPNPPHNNVFFFPLWTLALAVCLGLLGITSFLFHASLTRLAQTLDVAAIYWGLTVMGAANLSKFFALVPNKTYRWWSNMSMLVLSAGVLSRSCSCTKSLNSLQMLIILVLINAFLMVSQWWVFRSKITVL